MKQEAESTALTTDLPEKGTELSRLRTRIEELEAIHSSMERSQGRIEFSLEGLILDANQVFLDLLGYSLDEVRGQHESRFQETWVRSTPAYVAFWEGLQRGEPRSGVFKRLSKEGKDVWIQTTYTPILDAQGRPQRIVSFVTDVTREKLQYADYECQVTSIRRTQAVIEYDLEGEILDANEIFLKILGYSLEDVKGRNETLFLESWVPSTVAYQGFWAGLKRGEAQAGEFKRLTKSGREVWIQATYTPILDLDRRPLKVVSYATDVTEQRLLNADFQGQIEAIRRTQAVISFDPDGKILDANDLFLDLFDYGLDELRGRHHEMLLDGEGKNSEDTRMLWEALRRGEHQDGLFRRLGKGGKEVWLQATYTPILDLNGKTAKVVEFARDVSDQVDGEKQVEAIIRHAAAGDLKQRMDVHRYQGSMRRLGQGVNRLLEAIESPLDEIMEVVSHLGQGDFSRRIEGDYQGDFLLLKDSVNGFLDFNRELMRDLTNLAEGLAEGDLQRVLEAEYPGEFQRLKESFTTFLDFNRALMRDLIQLAEGMARGDLSGSLRATYPGEFLSLQEGFHGALESLNQVLGQAKNIVQEVAQAGSQLQETSQSMASVAQQQSSSAEESASALEETASMVKANAENAGIANQLVRETSLAAEDGRTKMESLCGSMEAISRSSRQIAKIIKVIDDIAFQTNLLALNAAVEAARAGRHGRGFAVVAQEVRNLAARSATAAKETSDLIDESGRTVQEGVAITNDTSAALVKIVRNVVKVKDLAGEISAASEEQSRGIDGVSKAMEQVNQGAQTANQQSSELAAAAEELGRQTEVLDRAIGRFKLVERAKPMSLGEIQGITPEMLQRALAIIQTQSQVTATGDPARVSREVVKAIDPKKILPLDQDERGFGRF